MTTDRTTDADPLALKSNEQLGLAPERAEFERWAGDYGRIFRERDGDGYTYPYTQEAWVGWQARANLDKTPPKVRATWPREAEDRVNQLLGQVTAKELECERLREALNFVAQHFSSDWPERCQSNVLTARRALGA